MFTSLLFLTALATSGGISGTVTGAHGEPLAVSYVAMYSSDWQKQLAEARTDNSGQFELDTPPGEGFLQVQPFRQPGAAQMLVAPWQPRVYLLGKIDATLTIKTPPAVTYVIAAYGEDGKVMRWKDWVAMGTYGQRFLFATDPSLRAVPAQVYPAFGPLSGNESQGRDEALPAVIVEPGEEIEIHALFWKTRGYGKLQLSARVPALTTAGDSMLINWNLALAEDAIARAKENTFAGGTDTKWFDKYQSELIDLSAQLPAKLKDLTDNDELESAEEAAAADAVLAKALDAADRIALERAMRRAKQVRYGQPASGDDLGGLKLKRPAFQFGVYQGSSFHAQGNDPYAGEPAFAAARDAGFTLATILPAWGWTGPFVSDPGALETTFGPGALGKMGYNVKAHGVLWLQDFMDILPPEMRGKSSEQIMRAGLNYQLSLIEALPDIDLWEALNEPATTNCCNFSRDEMITFLKDAAANLAKHGKTALVNSPHEFNYGVKYEVYTLDGKPLLPYPDTFASFLDAAAHAKALNDIDVIGLQVYPGFHLRGGKPGEPFEGPAWTPAFFERVLDTYARFRKVIHITEFSVPSTYGADWKAGYWKKPWDEDMQADYAEAMYTVAFGHPNVQAIGWWDITDEKPSIENGGLMHADRTPKPAFNRIANFIANVGLPLESGADFGPLYPGGVYTRADGGGEEVVVLPGARIAGGASVEVVDLSGNTPPSAPK